MNGAYVLSSHKRKKNNKNKNKEAETRQLAGRMQTRKYIWMRLKDQLISRAKQTNSAELTIMTITCLGKGAAGFTSSSGSGMSSFLISLRRNPVIQVHFEFILFIYFGGFWGINVCFSALIKCLHSISMLTPYWINSVERTI